MSANPHYDFEYVTTSDDAVPEALQGSNYWYDTGTTENAESVFYDTSNAYAYWNDGADWVITAVADVGAALVDYFMVQVGPDLTGFGAFSGTIAISEDTIADAWYRAETTAFNSFSAFVGATEGKDCFRGFLPVQGDSEDDKLSNVWHLTSGGSDEFDMDRVKGEDAAWCSLRADARIESLWSSRELAMKFSGAVIAWLKSTDNLKETGNVSWCTLADIPEVPEIYRTDGKKNRARLWRQYINLELVYSTGADYS